MSESVTINDIPHYYKNLEASIDFVQQKSCQAQLLAYLHDNFEALNTNEKVFFYYLDFSIAFDKVPHHLLLEKLRNFGIGGKLLNLLHSFLTFLRQCVKVDGFLSDYFDVLSGVPQASILGPLLFIIFIFDLPDYCLISCMFLFANDSKCRATNLYDLQLVVNRYLEWARKNGMILKINKTVFIHFSNCHVLPCPYYLTFDDIVITDKCEVRHLG